MNFSFSVFEHFQEMKVVLKKVLLSLDLANCFVLFRGLTEKPKSSSLVVSLHNSKPN